MDGLLEFLEALCSRSANISLYSPRRLRTEGTGISASRTAIRMVESVLIPTFVVMIQPPILATEDELEVEAETKGVPRRLLR